MGRSLFNHLTVFSNGKTGEDCSRSCLESSDYSRGLHRRLSRQERSRGPRSERHGTPGKRQGWTQGGVWHWHFKESITAEASSLRKSEGSKLTMCSQVRSQSISSPWELHFQDSAQRVSSSTATPLGLRQLSLESNCAAGGTHQCSTTLLHTHRCGPTKSSEKTPVFSHLP